MSVTVAVAILTWIALIVLYLGLAAVLREVRMLRRQVAQLSARQAQPAAGLGAGTAEVGAPATHEGRRARRTDLTLTPEAAGNGGPVLAATSTCPLCRIALDHMSRWAVATGSPATLLTYEPEADWGRLPAGVRTVRDSAAWSQIAHIEPPLLMDVAEDGTVRDVLLPASGADVDAALALWPVAAPQPSSPADAKESR